MRLEIEASRTDTCNVLIILMNMSYDYPFKIKPIKKQRLKFQ